MSNEPYDAIVIGAGHNGLVTAGYLARDGLKVLVLERLDKVGGATSTDELFPGLWGPMCSRVNSGLQGKVIDDLKLRDHGFRIARPQPPVSDGTRLRPYPDGTYLGGPGINGPIDAANQIREFSEHDAKSYFEWNRFWEEAASIFQPYMLTEPPPLSDIFADVRGTNREQILEKLITWCYLDLLFEYFEHPNVQAAHMTLPEVDPRSPGSLFWPAIIRTGQFLRSEDKGYPVGNMGAIADALASSAKSIGVDIRTNAPVERLLVENGEVKGVRIADGEEIEAPIVISNADPKRTFSTFVQTDDAPADSLRASGLTTQSASMHFHASISELPDFSRWLGEGYDRASNPGPHIAPSVQWYLDSWDDAQAGRWSRSPVTSILVPTLYDPTLAPRGGHMVAVWISYEPPKLKEGTWAEARQEAGEYMIDLITEYAPNFRRSIIDWSLQTPEDIETRVGMTDGNIRHIDTSPKQLLRGRFPYRTEIDGFYMCGAGTHPTGDVTGAPGHNAAHAILRDLERLSG